MAMLKAKKKSSIAAGKGTIITAKIQAIKPTIVKDLAFITGAIKGPRYGATRSNIFRLAI